MLDASASVNRLSLSLRTSALLREAGVRTIGELQQLTAEQLRAPRWTPAVRAELWAWLDPSAVAVFAADEIAVARWHDLKTHPEPFEAVRTGLKPFEIRRDDRGFRVGDLLRLREFEDVAQAYTGRQLLRRVSFILPAGQYGLRDGFVAMGLERGPGA